MLVWANIKLALDKQLLFAGYGADHAFLPQSCSSVQSPQLSWWLQTRSRDKQRPLLQENWSSVQSHENKGIMKYALNQIYTVIDVVFQSSIKKITEIK